MRFALLVLAIVCFDGAYALSRIHSLEFIGAAVGGRDYEIETYTWSSVDCSFQVGLYSSNGALHQLYDYVEVSGNGCEPVTPPVIGDVSIPHDAEYLSEYQYPKVKYANNDVLEVYSLSLDEWLKVKERWISRHSNFVDQAKVNSVEIAGLYVKVEPFAGQFDADWRFTELESVEIALDSNLYKIIPVERLPHLYSRLSTSFQEPVRAHIVDIAGRKYVLNVLQLH